MSAVLQPVAAPVPQAKPAPWLATDKLRLREFVPQDRERLVRMHFDGRMRALLIDDLPLHRHDVCAALIERLQALYRKHEGLGIWHAERVVPPPAPHDLIKWAVEYGLDLEQLQEFAKPRAEFAGWFNLMPMPADPTQVELGARLLPSAWGTGLAMEGGEQLLHHAFVTLGLERVWAVCHPRHDAVRCCVLALGFVDDGVRPYEGSDARYFVVDRARWRTTMEMPRGRRLRRSVAALREQVHAAD